MWNDVNLFISVNQKAIKLFGLESATYFAVITQIVPRVAAKQTADERGFFPIDRHYVEDQSGLDLEAQYHCDSILVKSGILQESAESRDKICVDLKRYFSVLTETDPKILDDIRKKAILSKTALERDASNARAAKKAEERAEKAKQAELEKQKREEKRRLDEERRESKQQRIMHSMMNHAVAQFSTFDENIKTQVQNWVKSVLAVNYLTFEAIDVFSKIVKEFSKNDSIVISKLLDIATVKSYKDPNWTIRVYQDQTNSTKFSMNKTTTSSAVKPSAPQKIASLDTVNFDEVF